MHRHQHKTTISNSPCNIPRPETSYPTTTVPEYSNAAKTQEKDLKSRYMKMVEFLKEVMIKTLEIIQETKNNGKEWLNP